MSVTIEQDYRQTALTGAKLGMDEQMLHTESDIE